MQRGQIAPARAGDDDLFEKAGFVLPRRAAFLGAGAGPKQRGQRGQYSGQCALLHSLILCYQLFTVRHRHHDHAFCGYQCAHGGAGEQNIQRLLQRVAAHKGRGGDALQVLFRVDQRMIELHGQRIQRQGHVLGGDFKLAGLRARRVSGRGGHSQPEHPHVDNPFPCREDKTTCRRLPPAQTCCNHDKEQGRAHLRNRNERFF